MNFQIPSLESPHKDFPGASLKPFVLQMKSAQRNKDCFNKNSKTWYQKHFKWVSSQPPSPNSSITCSSKHWPWPHAKPGRAYLIQHQSAGIRRTWHSRVQLDARVHTHTHTHTHPMPPGPTPPTTLLARRWRLRNIREKLKVTSSLERPRV